MVEHGRPRLDNTNDPSAGDHMGETATSVIHVGESRETDVLEIGPMELDAGLEEASHLRAALEEETQQGNPAFVRHQRWHIAVEAAGPSSGPLSR